MNSKILESKWLDLLNDLIPKIQDIISQIELELNR